MSNSNPIPIDQRTAIIDGVATELVIQYYSDRIFVILTQIGRIGQIVIPPSHPPLEPQKLTEQSPKIQVTIPALNLPPPPIRSIPNSLFPNLVMESPSASTTTQTLFGAPPSMDIGLFHELLAVQIASILLGRDGRNFDRELERNRPVMVGIGLKRIKRDAPNADEGGEGEGIGEGERKLFAGVMGMVLDCVGK